MTLQTIYDHPLYYDILFGFDRSKEADFYQSTFVRCGIAASEQILEVACGPARVARLLAQRGWRTTGLDRSAAMLELGREQAAAEGVALATLRGDMTAFSAPQHFGAAYNPISSFRLLHSDVEADAHLRCVAAALRSGGVYVLDLGFLGSASEPSSTTAEGWEMTRGEVTVRGDNDGVSVTDAGVRQSLAWGSEAHLRGYTTSSFAERIAACPDFAIESWHPESGRHSTGVSEFSALDRGPASIVRRAMVVLRRS